MIFNKTRSSANTMLLLLFCLNFHFSFANLSTPQQQNNENFDVIVYKSSPAGITSAIAAANNGKLRVALVEPLSMIGGMGAAGGLGLHDQQMSNLTMITGLAKTWAKLNAEYYYKTNSSNKIVNHPEIFVAEKNFQIMIDKAKSIDLMLECRLINVNMDRTEIPKIQSIDVICNNNNNNKGIDDKKKFIMKTLSAPVFIDASYDGDLMVGTNSIDYTYGRESTEVYNESLAGVQRVGEKLESFQGLNISATVSETNDTLIKYVAFQNVTSIPKIGSSDKKLMSFQHRACITTDQDNLVPFPQPKNYNREDFVLLQRVLNEVVKLNKFPKTNGPPFSYFTDLGEYSKEVFDIAKKKKYIICCGTAPVDSDQPNINRGWATANHAMREEIIEKHTYYLQGSFFYLANDLFVPEFTRNDAKRFGLCKDEFVKYNNWPPQLYIRSSNRLRGMKVMTQNNVANPRKKINSIAMGCWEFDQHTMARYGIFNKEDGKRYVVNEGFFRHAIDPFIPPESTKGLEPYDLWYDVPFEVMLPKREQCQNLIIPVALSASSVAFSSLRIETMYMDLGTAAGSGARQFFKSNHVDIDMTVQDIDVDEVRDILTKEYEQRIEGPFW